MNKQKLAAWADRELQSINGGGYLIALVLGPGAALIAAFGSNPLTLLLAVAWGGGWLAWLGWRIVVLCRRDDLEYDRRGKRLLAKDYHASESATAASRRRKRLRKKGETE